MGKISLNNIAEELAEKSSLTRDAAEEFMRAFVETIERGLQEDNVVKIKGLGTFKLQEMSNRESVDVNTGDRITIKGYRKVTFSPDSNMKELVNRPFAHFEPTELNDGYPTDQESEAEADDNDEAEVAEVAEVPAAAAAEVPAAVAVSATAAVEATEPVATEEVVETIVEEASAPLQVAVEPVRDEEPEAAGEVLVADDETSEVEADDAVVTTDVSAPEETEPKQEAEPEQDAEPEQEAVEVETTVTHDVEAPGEAESESHAPQSVPASRKRRGCGCLFAILFVVLALIVLGLGWFMIGSDTDASRHDDGSYTDMMVNPNLEEELGKEWADEPQVEPQLPTQKDTVPAVSEEQRAEPAISEQQADSVVRKEAKPAKPETVAPTADNKFCTVTITESLQGKSIKDITPADTTDYVMSGTLVTHELKAGETIIQLAVKYYGDKRLWPYIVKYNWMKDFNNVAIGQMVNIPVLSEKTTE